MILSKTIISLQRNLCESKHKRLLTLRARGCNATNNSGYYGFRLFIQTEAVFPVLNALAFVAVGYRLGSKVDVPYNY